MAELEAMKAQAAVEEQNKQMARDVFAAIDAGDFDSLNELFPEDFALAVPGIPEPLNYSPKTGQCNKLYAAWLKLYAAWLRQIIDIKVLYKLLYAAWLRQIIDIKELS